MPPKNVPEITARATRRNRGLRRVRYATGVLTASSAAGIAVLAAGYAHAMPGEASSATPSTAKHAQTAPSHAATTSPRTSSATTQAPQAKQTTQAKAPATSSAPTLQAPTQAPQSTSNGTTSQATSGGS